MSSSAGLSAAKRRRTKQSNIPTNEEREKNVSKESNTISIKDVLYLHEKFIHTNEKNVKDNLKKIQEEIDALVSKGKMNEKKIDENNNVIETLKKKVDELTLNISNLKVNISNLQVNNKLNEDLIQRIEMLENKLKNDDSTLEEKLTNVKIESESDSSQELESND